jgi:hypothetical protein
MVIDMLINALFFAGFVVVVWRVAQTVTRRVTKGGKP